LTGKNPGKHDVFDFFEFRKNAYKKQVIDINSIKTAALWEILERHHKKMIFMNVPIMYPPKPINGIMVSGALTPPGKKCAFPESLSRELYRDGYVVDVAYNYFSKLDQFYKSIKEASAKRFEHFYRLLNKTNWDLAMIVFEGVERLQQAVWERPDLIEEQYIEYDYYIGKFLEEGATVFIVSDHGFTNVEKKFFVNEWLADLGYLSKEIKVGEPSIPEFIEFQFGKWREDNPAMRGILQLGGFTSDKVRSIFPDSLSLLLKKFIPLKFKQALPKEHLIINWKDTHAYLSSRFSYAININLKGREPNGVVEPGKEYEEIRNQIMNELYRLRDPKTFENIIDRVHRGEDLFHGPYASNAPDIVFIPQNFSYSIEPDKRVEKSVISTSKDHAPVLSATSPNGIFLAFGEALAEGSELFNLKIWDIMPNILHLLEIPVPDDLDGKVRYDMFRNDCDLAHKEVEFDMSGQDYWMDPDYLDEERTLTQKLWEASV
jgi:predicted AlkP superfamily phosphohydrolase/phosphomutase